MWIVRGLRSPGNADDAATARAIGGRKIGTDDVELVLGELEPGPEAHVAGIDDQERRLAEVNRVRALLDGQSLRGESGDLAVDRDVPLPTRERYRDECHGHASPVRSSIPQTRVAQDSA